MTNRYDEVIERLRLMLEGEEDAIAIMATVACEPTSRPSPQLDGFYRVTAPEQLTVGPYQGGHGCLISFCAMRRRGARRPRNWCRTSILRHIACSSSTRPSWCYDLQIRRGSRRARSRQRRACRFQPRRCRSPPAFAPGWVSASSTARETEKSWSRFSRRRLVLLAPRPFRKQGAPPRRRRPVTDQPSSMRLNPSSIRWAVGTW